MASIRQRDGKFQVRIIRKGHRALSRTFTNRGDAVKWARAIEVEIERGAIQPHTRSITLADATRRYLTECTPRKKSARAEKYLLQAWASSNLGQLELGHIRPAQIAVWRDTRLSSGAAAQTVRNGLTSLSAVYEQAIREWGFDALLNPVRRIRRPAPPKARSRRVSNEEIRAIKAVTESPHLPDLMDLAVETAMRLGELVSLRADQINLNTRTITLNQTKNGHGRTIPLSPEASKILYRRLRDITGQPHDSVFPVSSHSVTVAFRRAVSRVGRMTSSKHVYPRVDKAIDDLRFHDLRREATSRLFERGLSVMEVASITGHRVLEMLRRYTVLDAQNIATKLGE
jgi:integrase